MNKKGKKDFLSGSRNLIAAIEYRIKLLEKEGFKIKFEVIWPAGFEDENKKAEQE